MMNGTAVVTVCCKQSTTAYNTTEAELDAATTITKRIQWLRFLAMILGCLSIIPFLLGKIILRHRS